ncbi:MAG: hypothetical protein K1X94_26080 [Sandaracinaceae bacterium]|nr:hypothetical protein [Sandaracinaceae bacterium]
MSVSTASYASQARGVYGPPCQPMCSPGYTCEYGRCQPFCTNRCAMGWGCVAPETCEPLCNPPCDHASYCGEDRRCHAGAPRARTTEPSQEWRPPPPQPTPATPATPQATTRAPR